ncbi:MAG: transposase [Acidobacteria bacterium]|nr:transposase [Acidobacteriota bacterium]
MPRRARIFVDGALYHVYCRTARGERVFAAEEEAEVFLELVRDVKERDAFAVLAWCLMPNHYHLLLRTDRVPLWRSMRLIQGRSAQGYNRRHRQLGSLWQERYKAKLVTDTTYLRTVVAYIHLNAVAGGLEARPGEYAWSGHREVLGARGHGVLDADAALALFGSSRGEARRAYRAVLAALRRDEDLLREPGQVSWWRRVAAGEDDSSAHPSPGRGLDASGASPGPDRHCVEPAVFLDHACAALGVERTRLASPRRDRATVRARHLVVLLAGERYGIRTLDLARALARRGDQVSTWMGCASRRKAEEAEFRRELDALDDALAGRIAAGAARPAGRMGA